MTSSTEPNRILLVRLSAIGDAILTLPMLCALRKRFPDAFIAWVTEPGPAKIIRGHSALDELIVIRRKWLKDPISAWRLRQRLQALNFDVALDPQGLTKSAALAWISGAGRRIGFTKPWGRELSRLLNNDLHVPQSPHVVDRQLGLLESLGISKTEAEFRIPYDNQAENSMAAFLDAQQLPSRFVVINPGATWDSKLWLPERFGAVARHLGLEHGIRSVVVWAGESEQRWAQEIERTSQGQALMAPATTLPELAVLLRRAELYLGSDTGPMHLAAAVGTRCVALFGPTRPEYCGPYGKGHLPIQAYYQAGSCRERRRASNDAMQAITVDTVSKACEQVLACSGTKAA